MRSFVMLVALVALAGCGAEAEPTTEKPPAGPSRSSPFGRDLAGLSDRELCDQALTDGQQEALALREVTPYEGDDGTKSCYYLRTPGESDVNEGFAVTIYRSSTELRSGLSGDSGGKLPMPVSVAELAGAEHVQLKDVSWSSGITVAADHGRYVYMTSWAPSQIIEEGELTRRTRSFAADVVTNLRVR